MELRGENQPIHRSFRKGLKKVIIRKGTRLYGIYKRDFVFEKHRYKYGVNLEYIDLFEKMA